MTVATATTAAQAAAPAAGSTLSAIGGMVFALLIVLALILALAWLLRRLPVSGMQAQKNLQVVASLSVGPKERLLVIEAGNTQLLIGVTANQISLLHELPTPLPAATQGPGFAALLAKRLGKESSP